jgi:hypothetical protein
MGGECGTYGGEDRCIQGFGGDTWGKETTWETQVKVQVFLYLESEADDWPFSIAAILMSGKTEYCTQWTAGWMDKMWWSSPQLVKVLIYS